MEAIAKTQPRAPMPLLAAAAAMLLAGCGSDDGGDAGDAAQAAEQVALEYVASVDAADYFHACELQVPALSLDTCEAEQEKLAGVFSLRAPEPTGEVELRGDRATVVVRTEGGSFDVALKLTDDGWRVREALKPAE